MASDIAGQIAFLNGRFIPAAECRLPIYDTGIVLSAAVTDFARTFHGKLYRLEDHVQRLYASARYARIDPPLPIERTLDLAQQLAAHNHALDPQGELGLVFYMTGGENPFYAGAAAMPSNLTATFAMHTFPLPFHVWKGSFLQGVHCVTPSTRHWPAQCLSSKIKHRNRLHMWIGDREARLADPAAVALYLDLQGNITETGGSNFVIYRRGTVISPRRNNILWGVSLTVLVELLAELNIPFQEDDLQGHDVINTDEAWLPTTPYCLAPVTKFNGLPVGSGKPGAMWRRILDLWSSKAGKNVYSEVVGTS